MGLTSLRRVAWMFRRFATLLHRFAYLVWAVADWKRLTLGYAVMVF